MTDMFEISRPVPQESASVPHLPPSPHHSPPLDIVVTPITEEQSAFVELLVDSTGVTRGLARELALRGIDSLDKYSSFVAPSLIQLPGWRELGGAEAAVTLIQETIKRGEVIALCCDYDVDGTTSGAILSHALNALKSPPLLLTPDRFTEGYGLNRTIIDKAHAAGARLIVTLDNGTHGKEEIAYAHSLGIKAIVIDHHHVPPGVHPDADVFINPKREECGFAEGVICTAGLTWMVANGLLEQASNDLTKLIPYVALATVCDVVPLVGANRILAKEGIRVWNSTKLDDLPALQVLKERVAQSEIDARQLGFRFGPLINAGGRSDLDGIAGGELVLRFLTAVTKEDAISLLSELHELNERRRVASREGFERACQKIVLQDQLSSVLFVLDEEMSEGVIGIVASRVAERFGRAAYIFTRNDEGLLKGSGRNAPCVRPITSGPELSLVEIQEAAASYVEKGGGHSGAVGVTVREEHFEAFKNAVNEEFNRRAPDYDLSRYIRASHEMTLGEIKADFNRFLKDAALLEPCDTRSNPPLSIALRDVQVVHVTNLERGHLKVLLRQREGSSDVYCTALLWNVSTQDQQDFQVGAHLDIACRPHLDGRVKTSHTTKDMCLSILGVRRLENNPDA